MSKISNTRFEVYISNSKRNDLQNVTGLFGSFSGNTFTEDICSAGFLCKTAGRLPLEGYAEYGLKNGNSHYMIAADNGKVTGTIGNSTGIFACNTYNVNSLSDGDITVNIPGKTLGLAVPAGQKTDFTEILVGESYNFGAGNFSTLPTDLSATPYATISNGLLVASASAPTDGTVYFAIEDITKRFTEGAFDGGQKITLKCFRADAVGENELPTVTTADNGKVLTVDAGAWAAKALPSE